MIIKREQYLRKILPFINSDIIKVLTGIRRCGKSVMMESIQNELFENGAPRDRFLVLNFESIEDERTKSINTVLKVVAQVAENAKSERFYCFFDEIQELNEWEKMVNSIQIDYPNADIYVTGSNAKLLSGELATYLGGRYVEIKIYPFSFAEMMELIKQNNSKLTEPQAFSQYLVRGGFPFLYNYPLSDDDCKRYVHDIFNSIILKDISQRHKIRDISLLEQVIHFFIVNVGNTFSANSIAKYLRSQNRAISTETLYNYLNYCQSSCLLHLVKRQDLTDKTILATQEKIFLADHGIREALYGNNRRDINQILENIIFMELLRKDYQVNIGKMKDTEIDFVAQKGGERIYLQVCYLLADENTVNRKFGIYERITDNYPKYVLSMDEIDRSCNGIIHKNIRDFLMGR